MLICDVSAGDMYHQVSQQPAQLDVADAVFSNTAGREPKVLGSQNTEFSSKQIRFAAEGPRLCRIVKANRAAMLTFLASVDTFMKNDDNLTGTLSWVDGTEAGVRMAITWTSGIMTFEVGGKCYIDFEAVFSKYTP